MRWLRTRAYPHNALVTTNLLVTPGSPPTIWTAGTQRQNYVGRGNEVQVRQRWRVLLVLRVEHLLHIHQTIQLLFDELQVRVTLAAHGKHERILHRGACNGICLSE